MGLSSQVAFGALSPVPNQTVNQGETVTLTTSDAANPGHGYYWEFESSNQVPDGFAPSDSEEPRVIAFNSSTISFVANITPAGRSSLAETFAIRISVTLRCRYVVPNGIVTRNCDGQFDSPSFTQESTVITVRRPNTAPTANAGVDQRTAGATQVTLSGSGTDAEPRHVDRLTYAWTQTGTLNRVTLAHADTATPTFIAPNLATPTTLTFQLTVTDGGGLSTTDTVSIPVDPNTVPTASEITTLNKAITPRLTQAVIASTITTVSNRIDAVFSDSQAANYALDSNTWRQKLPAYVQSLADDSSDWKQVLGDASFVLPLNAVEGSSGGEGAGDAGITVWGSGDYTKLNSDGDIDWNGSLFSLQLGLDKRVRHNLLVGGLLSRSAGDIDYTLNGKQGKYSHKMTSVHPYLAWSDGGVNLWGSAGYGQGKLEIKENDLKNSADTTLLSLAAGVKGALPQIAGLSVKGDIALVQTRIQDSVDGDFEISKQTINSQRLRVLLESERPRTLASGGTFTPIMELGVRYDGGDGDNGVGALLGAGMRYANITGLSMEGKVHTFVGPNNYKEWGVSGVIRQQTEEYGRGLSFSLSPSYGHTGSNENQLGQGNPDYNARLNVNIGYGLLAPGGGLLTPYSEITVAEQARNYRLGLRWKPDSPFTLHLVGERRESNGGIDGAGNNRILLESTIRF